MVAMNSSLLFTLSTISNAEIEHHLIFIQNDLTD